MSTSNTSKAIQALTGFFHFRPISWDFYLSKDPCFSSLLEKEKRGVAAFLWAMYANAIPHKSHQVDLTPIHWKAKKAIFGSAARFDDINGVLGWFDKELEGRKGRYASGWQLTAKGHKVASGYFFEFFENLTTENAGLVSGLIDAAGSSYRTPSDAFRSTTATGAKCRFPRGMVHSLVNINTHNLIDVCKAAELWVSRSDFPERLAWLYEKWNEYRMYYGSQKADARVNLAHKQSFVMLTVAHHGKVGNTFVPTIYSESKAGRLYAMGHVNLQRCVGEVRHLALQGCYDVDIENCHWSLLAQMAKRSGIDTPSISYYLNNKRLVRSEISRFSNISIDDAKFVLISLIYGAVLRCRSPRESFDDKKNAIEAKLGRDVVEMLAGHPVLQGLIEDLKLSTHSVVEHYRNKTRKKGGVIVNDAGREIDGSIADRKILSHILQGAESEAMRVMVEVLNNNIVLLQHDGVTVKVKPDLVELERRIKEDTGFTLKLEADLLQ